MFVHALKDFQNKGAYYSAIVILSLVSVWSLAIYTATYALLNFFITTIYRPKSSFTCEVELWSTLQVPVVNIRDTLRSWELVFAYGGPVTQEAKEHVTATSAVRTTL